MDDDEAFFGVVTTEGRGCSFDAWYDYAAALKKFKAAKRRCPKADVHLVERVTSPWPSSPRQERRRPARS